MSIVIATDLTPTLSVIHEKVSHPFITIQQWEEKRQAYNAHTVL